MYTMEYHHGDSIISPKGSKVCIHQNGDLGEGAWGFGGRGHRDLGGGSMGV